jgi:hypothetical protein
VAAAVVVAVAAVAVAAVAIAGKENGGLQLVVPDVFISSPPTRTHALTHIRRSLLAVINHNTIAHPI